MVDVGPLTPEEMLARAAANVKSGNTSKNMSAVQKLLAQRDTPLPEDTVELSPVQKMLAEQKKAADKITDYFESEEYLQLKISQLRGQLAIYSTLPGLDPSGAVTGGIEAEIKSIIEKQNAELQESLKIADEKKAQLAEQERLKALELPSPETLLAKLSGTAPKALLSKEVQALLENAKKGASVDTSA